MVPTHALHTLCASHHPSLVSLLFMPSLYSLFLIRKIFNLLVYTNVCRDSKCYADRVRLLLIFILSPTKNRFDFIWGNIWSQGKDILWLIYDLTLNSPLSVREIDLGVVMNGSETEGSLSLMVFLNELSVHSYVINLLEDID